MRVKWEYGTFRITGPIDEGLSELGAEGWEFCAILERTKEGSGFLMKREKAIVTTDLSSVPRSIHRSM